MCAPVIPETGETPRDRRIPGACWPASLVEQVTLSIKYKVASTQYWPLDPICILHTYVRVHPHTHTHTERNGYQNQLVNFLKWTCWDQAIVVWKGSDVKPHLCPCGLKHLRPRVITVCHSINYNDWWKFHGFVPSLSNNLLCNLGQEASSPPWSFPLYRTWIT